MPHLIRDGTRISYDEAGSGDPALVCVHGWCCNATHVAPQFEHFSAKHRVISIDLPGHGGSGPADGACSIAGFADEVAWICGELRLTKPVIVGHSMGGAIALSLSVRHPALASAIVMLDGAVVPPAELLDLAAQLATAFDSDGYLDPLTAIVDRMFMDTDDRGRRAEITKAMTSMPQPIVAAEWKALWANDSVADAQACKIPALYIGSHAPVADMARLRELMPHVILAQTAGAGHFHQLEVPDQVNAMIERFLAINGI